ncbi:hypothetical protein ASE36_01785 [Rhizobium sp. Root274]|uniref:hypothetical protein n=1 Tax=unclassified Rhizobium TaxID=2613769 RepID=UPI000714FCC6|nr:MULTISPECIES: hypothetical protein [unclassified Rhizobium]KQW31049.1 hypothetical protein ASC71_01785 [Rhizobium sp. Root1240]KRD32597.1 hypothetical protein ASE36_01785 [Rhizobium sp. Root274]
MEGIPDPSKSAKTVSAISLTVLADLVPGGSAFRDLVGAYQSKKIEEYRQLLLTEIHQRGLKAFDDLSDTQIEFIIPAAYRFFEQVRLGEYRHNLKILARFLANGLVDQVSLPKPGDVGRLARQLEYLDELELRVLAASIGFSEASLSKAKVEQPFISVTSLGRLYPKLLTQDDGRLRAALAVLSARGFLYPDGAVLFDKSEETYHLTEDTVRLSGLVNVGEA